MPRRVRLLDATSGSPTPQWEDLRLPIDLAFFFHSTPQGKTVACYPSPAGATESLLDLEAWDDLSRDNPVLAALAPDVEALLVNRVARGRGGEPGRRPTSSCRSTSASGSWASSAPTGAGSRAGAWCGRRSTRFFADLTRRAQPVGEALHA